MDVTQLTDLSGEVTRDYDYDPYGVQLTDAMGDTNPFRYKGEYFDEETGFIYLRARYYDPAIGRFISLDPAKDGLNWYVYCGNNPINFWDPTGLAYDPLMDPGFGPPAGWMDPGYGPQNPSPPSSPSKPDDRMNPGNGPSGGGSPSSTPTPSQPSKPTPTSPSGTSSDDYSDSGSASSSRSSIVITPSHNGEQTLMLKNCEMKKVEPRGVEGIMVSAEAGIGIYGRVSLVFINDKHENWAVVYALDAGEGINNVVLR